MAIEPKVLVVWGQYPRWIPPATFSTRQVTIAARLKQELRDQSVHNFNYFPACEPDGWQDAEEFDLAQFCDENRLGRDFDFIVVYGEEDMGMFPANLGEFHCPAILLVGDTHHFKRPISSLLSYARREKIRMAAVQFAGQHMHWFKKGGIQACAWTPGLITQHAPRNLHTDREDQIAFVGHSWDYHYRRSSLLQAMRAAGLPIEVSIGTREEAADNYSGSLISFNCSLNSEINIRNFEVLSSGGFLLTEELPDVTGFQQLFDPGGSCETYRDADDLLEKIAFYRRNPGLAYSIATKGHERFCSWLTPHRALAQFRKAFFDGNIDQSMVPPDPRWSERAEPDPANPSWLRRLHVYEDIQELHRERAVVDVLVEQNADWLNIDDFRDLPRVHFHSNAPRHSQTIAITTEMATNRVWDYVCGAQIRSKVAD